MEKKKVELLAPAGSPEGFYGAIHAGADAVYLGGEKFGARAYAENFTEEELTECIRYAHLWGRKVYLTVNTLMKDAELDKLEAFLSPFYEAGLDGVIVQDWGALLFIRERFPDMELHASTQMTVTGVYGARYLKAMGVTRIVPARELGLDELKEMRERAGVEIEVFVHGAMCYCYSGQCLFSSLLGGRSGNRGRCAQPCRLPYSVCAGGKESQVCYPLSLKDLCTIEMIPRLICAGVDSFKIEGRMKKAEYAAGVTAIYRKYIDAFYSNPQGKSTVSKEDLALLSRLYIRSERQTGYFDRHNGADMVTLESPAYGSTDEDLLKLLREKFVESRPRKTIHGRVELIKGRPALLTLLCGKTIVTVSGEIVPEAVKQPVTAESVRTHLKKMGNTIFSLEELDVKLSADSYYPVKGLNDLRRQAVTALEDELIREQGLCPGRNVSPANHNSVTDEHDTAADHNSALEGKYATAANHISTPAREYPAPAGQLPGKEKVIAGEPAYASGRRFTLSLHTLAQCHAAIDFLNQSGAVCICERVYVNGDLWRLHPGKEMEEAVEALSAHTAVYLTLPGILRKQDKAYLAKVEQLLLSPRIAGCMVKSLEGYAFLTELHYMGGIASDANFYIWNKEAMQYWQTRLTSLCLPVELNAAEQHQLILRRQGAALSADKVEKIVYGYLPMMVSANCVKNTLFGCRRKTGVRREEVYLKDRYGKHFPVEIDCIHCRNIIYNTVPLSLHTSLERWENHTLFRLNFTVEGEKETGRILAFFKDPCGNSPYLDYTTGHEKRGVE